MIGIQPQPGEPGGAAVVAAARLHQNQGGNIHMTFGEKLLRLRKQEGLSQEELAERLDVSRQAVSRWETGETLPDAPNLLQISRIFGVSADYLLHDEFESDGDLPAVRSAESKTRQEARVRWTVRIFLLLHAVVTFNALVGIYVFQQMFYTTLCITLSVCSVVGFEAGFYYAGTRGPLWSGARDWRRRYYRAMVWLALFPPVRCVAVSFFQFWPRPCPAVVPELCAAAVYLAVCLLVTFLLRPKTAK